MSGARRVRAALGVAATYVVCCLCVCAEPSWAGDDRAQALLFSGTDLWHDGAFMHGGALLSPGGLDSEGFTLKLMTSGGLYRYRSGALNNETVVGSEATGEVMPGWRFKRDRLQITVYGGLDIQQDATSPNDPSNRLHGRSIGARASVDLWDEPTPATMLAADASLSSIATGYSARIAYGWRVMSLFYLGPEAQTFACDGYRLVRAGAQVTAFKTGPVEWSAAAGWSYDSARRSSPYLRLGVLTRQ
jgi:Cellulose biosynthesis protein BcsS